MDEESKALLAQMLEELRQMRAMSGNTAKAAEDTTKALNNLTDDLGEAAEFTEDLNDAQAELTKAMHQSAESFKQSLRSVGSSVMQFGSALTQTTGKLGDLGGGFDSLGDAALEAGKALGTPFAMAAGLAAKAFTTVANAALKQTDAVLGAKDEFSKLGGVGLGTGKDILSMAHAAKISSKNLDLLVKPMQGMTGTFQTLGTTVADGQKAFLKLTAVGDQQLAKFGRLGISQEELIKSQADFLNLQAQSGRNIKSIMKDEKAMQAASLKYTENLVELAAITGTDLEGAKKAQEFAANQYAEVVRTRQEDNKIRNLEKQMANARNDEERKAIANEISEIKFRQESRKQLTAQAKEVIGEKEAAALAQAVATGMIGPGMEGLISKGVDPIALQAKLNAAKNEEERQKVIDRELGAIVDATSRQVDNFGDTITYMSAETQRAAGVQQETIVATGKVAGKDLEEVRRLAKEQLAAQAAAGTDPMADSREDLRKTQRNLAVGLDDLLLRVNPLTTAYGLQIGAVVALTTAVGTAALSLRGLSKLGALGGGAGGAGGLLGGVTGGGGAAGAAGSGAGGMGKALGSIGAGAGKGLEGVLRGAAGGLSAFANPMVVAGAAGMGAAITLIGAGLAGASWIMGKALPTLAEGFEAFTLIDGDALKKTGIGIGALGAGLAVFGAGGAAASFGSVASSVADGLGSFFGAKTPFDKIEEFSKLDINAAKVEENAKAFAAFGSAMAAYGGGSALKGLGDMAAGIGDFLGGLIGTSSPVEKIEEFGRLKIDEGNLEKNAKAFAAFGNAMKAYTGGATASAGDLFSVWAESKGVENPVEAMKKFAALDLGEGADKRVENNAKAFTVFAEAMSKYQGGGAATVGDLVGSVSEGLGANPPLEKMKAFAALDLGEGADKRVETNAKAFVEFSNAMASYKGGATTGIGEAISSSIAGFFDGEPPTAKLEKFSKIQIDDKGVAQVKRNADAFVAFSNAISSYKGGATESVADTLLNPLKKALGGGNDAVIEKFVKFTKLDVDPDKAAKLATAFSQYAGAMATFSNPRAARAAATGAAPVAAGGGGGGAASASGSGGGGGAAGGGSREASGGGGGILSRAAAFLGFGGGSATSAAGEESAAGGGAASTAKLPDGAVQMGQSVRIGNQIKKGGTVSWRTNNPGNISYGGLAKKYGAIGTWKKLDGDAQQRSTGIAIMPSLEAGDNLKMALWRRPMYIDKTIDQGVMQWTGTLGPGSGYARDLARSANADLTTRLRDLSDSQLRGMVQKQRVWEGFKEGQTVQAKLGGITSGPESGYPATLHGKEMIVPLQGDSLLEKLGTMSANMMDKESGSGMSSNVESLMQNMIDLNQKTSNEWISKLDRVIDVLENQRATQEKTLRAVRT